VRIPLEPPCFEAWQSSDCDALYTTDLRLRLTTHNSGGSKYTARYRPWRLITCLAFSSKPNALGFERYLKSHSGMAFAAKRLW
jgi:hypothetical protein